MAEYLVRWEIDIEADNPQEAAEKALAIQRNPESIATVFYVEDKATREDVVVDLLPEEAAIEALIREHARRPRPSEA